MILLNQNSTTTATAQKLISMVVYSPKNEGQPIYSKRFLFAAKVAKVLECDLFEIIGVKNTENKILAIWLHVMLHKGANWCQLQRDFSMNQRYVRSELLALDERLLNDDALMNKVIRLEAAFFNAKIEA